MAWYQFLPPKAVKRFIITQAVFTAITISAGVLSLRYFIGDQFLTHPELFPMMSRIDAFLLKLGWLLFLLSLVFSFWVAYVHFHSLGRLLAKAKSIKRGTYKRQWDQEMEPSQDFGEWYELELTLNKINREIKKHKQDKKRREIEIETLAGAVSDGIIAIDALKRVEYFNGQMALILGKVFDPLSPPSYLDEVFRAPKLTLAVDDVIATGTSKHIQIPMRPHKSLENHVFDVIVTPVKSEKKQKFYGVIAVFHDITEAKKVEEMRIDFVANASHELKTPLTSIKGYVDALASDIEKNDVVSAKDKMAIIEKNVDRLNELVKDLLTLSRLDVREETSKEEVPVEEFTDEVLRELRTLAQDKKQNINVDIKTHIVKANRLMLGQVMSNLIENAIKYCDTGAAIRICWSENDRFVILKVADNGPGVSEEHLARLFERFYRVQHGRAKSGVTGTGLGLSIARNSMLRLGGRIEVDSVPGKGTEFICYFPKS